MKTTLLRPAYAWDCPQCGVENFVRSVTAEMAPETEQALRDDRGIQPWHQGVWERAPPTQVRCRACRTLCNVEDAK